MDFIILDRKILKLPNEALLKELEKYEDINLIKIGRQFLIYKLISGNNEHYEVLENLINRKYNPLDVHIFDTYSTLHRAINMGHFKTIKLMLDKGVDVNRKTTTCNESPLNWAFRMETIENIELLFEYGAVVDHEELSSYSWLFWGEYKKKCKELIYKYDPMNIKKAR